VHLLQQQPPPEQYKLPIQIMLYSSPVACQIKILSLKYYYYYYDYYYYYNHFMALRILSGTSRVSRYQKKHSPSHTYHGHQSSLICFLHLLWYMASSLFNLHALQSFSIKFSLVYLLAWHPPLHTPYISSPNLCLFSQHMPYHRNLICCSTEII